MGLHDPVNGLTMFDVLLGLESGDHRRGSPNRANDQGPETDLAKAWPPGHHSDQLEQDRSKQQRRGKVVQCCMKLGPVVAEHGRLLQQLFYSPKSDGTAGSTE